MVEAEESEKDVQLTRIPLIATYHCKGSLDDVASQKEIHRVQSIDERHVNFYNIMLLMLRY